MCIRPCQLYVAISICMWKCVRKHSGCYKCTLSLQKLDVTYNNSSIIHTDFLWLFMYSVLKAFRLMTVVLWRRRLQTKYEYRPFHFNPWHILLISSETLPRNLTFQKPHGIFVITFVLASLLGFTLLIKHWNVLENGCTWVNLYYSQHRSCKWSI